MQKRKHHKEEMIKTRCIAHWRLSPEALFVVGSCAITSVSGQHERNHLFAITAFKIHQPKVKYYVYAGCNV